MARIKLTPAAVERIKAPPVPADKKAARAEYFDILVPGLCLRVTYKGRKSWALMYRHGGKLRRLTLGSYPALGLVKARRAARKALEMVADGTDPAIAKREAKRRDETQQRGTFAAVAKDFLNRHGKTLRPRSLEEVERPFEKWLQPRWDHRRIEDIARRDVIDLIDEIMDAGTPVAANRTLAVVKKFFNWCVERGVLDTSPAAAVKRPAKEQERQRVLTDDEIALLWPAWDTLGYPFGDFHKMLILTAQRRNEVSTMKWSDLDLDADDQSWHVPAEVTKAARAHDVPLSPLAVELLDALPRFSGPYVFSTTDGRRPISGYSRAKARADKLSGVEDWTLHDLRRTAGTRMTQLGVPVFVVGRVLNHAPRSAVGITSVYDRHSYEPEKRHALDTGARKLESIVRPGDDKKVVPLRG